MSDQQLISQLIAGNPLVIEDFFFVRCRAMLTYIGQYFCQEQLTAEELIGEFYEFLSADDWHKLRIFQYSCSLNSYISIIAARYFQHKRDQETIPLDDVLPFVDNPYKVAWEFVSQDKKEAMVTVMTKMYIEGPNEILKLKGLDPNKFYRCEQNGEVASGALLMRAGVNISRMPRWDGESFILYFTEV